MSDMQFEQLLAKYNQDFIEAKVFNTIMPDDGNYVISVGALEKGEKDGVPWWKLMGRVEVAENPLETKCAGMEFQIGFYGPKTFGFMKEASTALAGHPVSDLREALEVLESSAGVVANAKIVTTTSKKDSKNYTNCYIVEVIDDVQPDTVGEVLGDLNTGASVEDAPESVDPVANES